MDSIRQYLGWPARADRFHLGLPGARNLWPAHSRNVILSLLLGILAFIGGLALGLVFIGEAIRAVYAQDPQALASTFRNLALGALILGAITGPGQVLLTYALQRQEGKVLLLMAYGISLVLGILLYVVLRGTLAALEARAPGPGSITLGDLTTLRAEIARLGLLSAIPAIVYAAAYYIAWLRIDRREIPGTPGGPLPEGPLASPSPHPPHSD